MDTHAVPDSEIELVLLLISHATRLVESFSLVYRNV